MAYLGKGSDAEEPLAQLALLYEGARPPRAAVIVHLLVGKDGVVHRVPVHDCLLAVHEPGRVQAQEECLRPSVVLGRARGNLLRCCGEGPSRRDARRGDRGSGQCRSSAAQTRTGARTRSQSNATPRRSSCRRICTMLSAVQAAGGTPRSMAAFSAGKPKASQPTGCSTCPKARRRRRGEGGGRDARA